MQQGPPASTSRRKVRRSFAIGLSRASSSRSTRRTAGTKVANEEMEVEMDDGNESEGMSTSKKVVAGAAVGVAVPAAVGVAKKLLGNGDDQQNEGRGQAERSGRKSKSSGGGRSSQATRARSATSKRSSGRSSANRS